MLEENFEAHQDQHKASDQLGSGAVSGAEGAAQSYADCGQDKGNTSDKTDGGNDLYLQKGKGNPHGQRVNAGGYGQRKHGFDGKGVVQRLRFPAGFPDHVESDESQKEEGDPVIDAGNHRLEAAPQKVADQGHQRLEPAKVKTGSEHVFFLCLSYGKALTDRDRKGVHRQADSNNKQFPQFHFLTSTRLFFFRSGVVLHKKRRSLPAAQISLVISDEARNKSSRMLASPHIVLTTPLFRDSIPQSNFFFNRFDGNTCKSNNK